MTYRLAFFLFLFIPSCLATVIQGPLLNADGTNASCSLSATPFTGSPTVIRYQVKNGLVAFALNPGMYNVTIACQSATVTVKSYTWSVPDTDFINITSLLGGPVLTNDQTIPIVLVDPTAACNVAKDGLTFSKFSSRFFQCSGTAWVPVSGSSISLPLTESQVTNLISDLGSKLSTSNNLSELTSSAATVRTNLGLGSSSIQPSTAYDASGASVAALASAQASSLQKTNNLSDIVSPSAARLNLGLGTASVQPSSSFDLAGSAASAASASDPLGSANSVLSSSLQKSSNLSDLANTANARVNLGLGSASVQAGTTGALVGTSDTQSLTNKTIDGISPATLAFVDPSSSIQAQINGKQPTLGFVPQNAATANVNNDLSGAANSVLLSSAQKTNNLSDLSSLASARTNLGLGSIALLNTIPTTALSTVQGNGPKVQLATGTPTSGDCVKFDVNGNVIDAGAACGTGGALPTGTPNQILATDASGSATNTVAVRAMVANDVPSLAESKITNLTSDLAGKQATIGYVPQNAATANSNNDSLGAAASVLSTSAQKANNLSDLSSPSSARTNLGLGSAAVTASTAYDASGAANTAQANAIAASDPAGSASTVQSASLQKSANLSDLSNVSTARTNLGLAPSATVDATNASNISSGTLATARIPTLNQSTTGTSANVTGIVALANGGTGTSSPALVAGTNVTLSGSFPNQTINATSSGASLTAANTYSVAGATSAPGELYTGSVFTGGTGTTTLPFRFHQPTGTSVATTWNVNGTYIGINAASGFIGNFLDFRVNGATSAFSVSYQGYISNPWLIANNLGVTSLSGLTQATTYPFQFTSSTKIYGPTNGMLQFTNTTGTSFTRLQFGTTTATSPALTTTIQTNPILTVTDATGGLTASLQSPMFTSVGSAPTLSGCSATISGKSTAGQITSGTSGTCTTVLTFSIAAPTGYSCASSDLTTANLYRQTASSTTSATFSGTTNSADVISYMCMAY